MRQRMSAAAGDLQSSSDELGLLGQQAGTAGDRERVGFGPGFAPQCPLVPQIDQLGPTFRLEPVKGAECPDEHLVGGVGRFGATGAEEHLDPANAR
jgi:hypothetical protein